MTDIYQILDDGRIMELKLGHYLNCDNAVWARKLSAQEKCVYYQLKSLGYTDMTIYHHLNPQIKKDACVRRSG